MLFSSTYLSAALALLNDVYYNNAATDAGTLVDQSRLIFNNSSSFLEVAYYKAFTVNKLVLCTNYVLMALDLLASWKMWFNGVILYMCKPSPLPPD